MRWLMLVLSMMISMISFAQTDNQLLQAQNQENFNFIQSVKQNHEKELMDRFIKTQKDMNKLAMKISADALSKNA